jgi:flagellar basal-body rod protein FlgC
MSLRLIFNIVSISVTLVNLSIPVAFAVDPLISSVETSSSAMRAQGARIKIISQNIANQNSTGFTPGAAPYRRKTISFKNKYDKKTGTNKVVVSKYGEDKSDFIKRYQPNHPAADKDGYVLYPNVNTIIETADAREAQRSYDANLSTIEVTKSMISRTLELLK